MGLVAGVGWQVAGNARAEQPNTNPSGCLWERENNSLHSQLRVLWKRVNIPQ
jgi:hypothetical protein